MAALAQMELDIKRERVTDSVAKRRAAGQDLGGKGPTLSGPTRACCHASYGQLESHRPPLPVLVVPVAGSGPDAFGR
jgi:hypothetical protein